MKTTVTAKAKNTSSERKNVVWKCAGFGDDGWHSYGGDPEKEVDSYHATKKSANARVREVFFHQNPWGIGDDEFEQDEIEEETDQGLLSLTVSPPDSETWIVKTQDRIQFERERQEEEDESDDDAY